jgi:hypothetical protein
VPPNRKPQAVLAKLLSVAHLGLVLNEHFEEHGAIIYLDVCLAARASGFVWLKRNARKIRHWYLLRSLGCDGGHRLRSMGVQETNSLAGSPALQSNHKRVESVR